VDCPQQGQGQGGKIDIAFSTWVSWNGRSGVYNIDFCSRSISIHRRGFLKFDASKSPAPPSLSSTDILHADDFQGSQGQQAVTAGFYILRHLVGDFNNFDIWEV
jgi:hypothetical protein